MESSGKKKVSEEPESMAERFSFLPNTDHLDTDDDRVMASDYFRNALEKELKKLAEENTKNERIDLAIFDLCLRLPALDSLSDSGITDDEVGVFKETVIEDIRKLLFKDSVLSWDVPSLMDFFRRNLEVMADSYMDTAYRKCFKDDIDIEEEGIKNLINALGTKKSTYPDFIDNLLKVIFELRAVNIGKSWTKSRELQFEASSALRSLAKSYDDLMASSFAFDAGENSPYEVLDVRFLKDLVSLFSNQTMGDRGEIGKFMKNILIECLGFEFGENLGEDVDRQLLLLNVRQQIQSMIANVGDALFVKQMDLLLLFLQDLDDLLATVEEYFQLKSVTKTLAEDTDERILRFMPGENEYDLEISEINDVEVLYDILMSTTPITEEYFSRFRSVAMKLKLMDTFHLVEMEFDSKKTERISSQLRKEINSILTNSKDGDGVLLNAGIDGEILNDTVLLDFLKVGDAKEGDSAIMKIVNKELSGTAEIKDWVRLMAMLTLEDTKLVKQLVANAHAQAEKDNRGLKITDFSEEFFEIFERIINVFLSKFGTRLEHGRTRSSIISGGVNVSSMGNHFAVHITWNPARLRDLDDSKLVLMPLEFQIRLYEGEDDHNEYKQTQFDTFARKMAMNVTFEQFVLGMMVALDVRKAKSDKLQKAAYEYILTCLMGYFSIMDPDTKCFVNHCSFEKLAYDSRNVKKIEQTINRVLKNAAPTVEQKTNLGIAGLLIKLMYLRNKFDLNIGCKASFSSNSAFLNEFIMYSYKIFGELKDNIENDLCESLFEKCTESISYIVENKSAFEKGDLEYAKLEEKMREVMLDLQILFEDNIIPLDPNSDGADGAVA